MVCESPLRQTEGGVLEGQEVAQDPGMHLGMVGADVVIPAEPMITKPRDEHSGGKLK